MDKDYFNVAIIVLVVLAQLGGTIVAAWKKRKAAREAAARRGGLVVVQDESPATPRSEPRRTSSWDNEEEETNDPWGRPRNEAEEDPEEFWEEHAPGEFDEAPAPAPAPAHAVQESRFAGPRPDPARHAVSPAAATGRAHVITAGVKEQPSKAKRILGRGGLRNAILAQVILSRPASRGVRR